MSYFDYFESLLPLIIPQIFLPPISYFNGTIDQELPAPIPDLFRSIYSVLPVSMMKASYIRSLMLTFKKSIPYYEDSSWLTHVFIHADYHHLFSNIYSTVLVGKKVFHRYGPMGMYTVYIIGGLLAIAPLTSDGNSSTLVDSNSSGNDLFNGFFQPIVNSVHNFVNETVLVKYYCGSSGAACALMGANIIVGLDDIYHYISNYYNYDNTERVASMQHILFQSLDFYLVGQFIIDEYRLMNGAKPFARFGAFGDILRWFSPTGGNLINHAAHLQGFAVGVSIALVLEIMKSRKPKFPGEGRRLY